MDLKLVLLLVLFDQVSGMWYMGCYVDSSKRILATWLSRDVSNTPARCMQRCKDGGYRYAGVQGLTHCFCGNDWRRTPQKVAENECEMSCPGDNKYTCGDDWRMNVYSNMVCDANPCQTGCTCSESPGGYTCECPSGRTVTSCQTS